MFAALNLENTFPCFLCFFSLNNYYSLSAFECCLFVYIETTAFQILSGGKKPLSNRDNK